MLAKSRAQRVVCAGESREISCVVEVKRWLVHSIFERHPDKKLGLSQSSGPRLWRQHRCYLAINPLAGSFKYLALAKRAA